MQSSDESESASILRWKRKRPYSDSEPETPSQTTAAVVEHTLITHVRAPTDLVAARLARIPVGSLHVTVRAVAVLPPTAVPLLLPIGRTANKPASVVGRSDVVEWEDEIVLLSESDRSSRISLTVCASFEMEPTLGSGELLYDIETSLGELLERDGQLESIKPIVSSDGETVFSRSSLHVGIERRALSGRDEREIASHAAFEKSLPGEPEEETRRLLTNLTDGGHRALVCYRQHQEGHDLDESVASFERARDVCPHTHSRRDVVLSNLATAKMMYCRRSLNDSERDRDASPPPPQSSPPSVPDSEKLLDVPIDLYRTVLDLRPRGHPDRPLALLNLGVALLARFQRRQGAEEDEAEGRAFLSQALDIVPTDSHVYHAAFLALECAAGPELIRAIQNSRSTEDDFESDDENDEHEEEEPEGEQEIVQRLDDAFKWIFFPNFRTHGMHDHLGVLFCVHFDCLGELVSPDKEISVMEVVVRFTPDDHPDKPSRLNDLGTSLLTRYERFGDVGDLDKALSMVEEAVRLTPDGDADKPGWLNNLGNFLSTRYDLSRDLADLDRSISTYESAVSLTPDDDPNRPRWLNNLGNSLSARYDRFRDVDDLERSISVHKDAVRLTSDGHPGRPASLDNLGNSLLVRYRRFGDVDDLKESMTASEEAVRLTPDGHPDEPLRLSDLGKSLLARYERSDQGDVDLERSISITEQAVRLTEDGDSNKPARLNNLAESLLSRYKRSGDAVDLDKSISAREDAVRLMSDGRWGQHLLLSNLGNSLLARYGLLGKVDDLERSMSMHEEAVGLAPDCHPDKPLLLSNFGSSILTHYERFGNLNNLEKTISISRDAVRLTPVGDPDRPARLSNLGNSLLTRYERFGDLVDLETLILLYDDAVELTPECDPDKPLMMNNLANSLSTRYERLEDAADLEKAISMHEDAVRIAPDGHAYKPGWLNDLGNSLLTRYGRFRDVVDLEKSISKHGDAVRLVPVGHPDRPGSLNNLSNSLLTRYVRFEDVRDLERSIESSTEAVGLTADGHPDKPLWLYSLARSLFKRFQRSGDLSSPDLSQAISYSSAAARSRAGTSVYRFRASELWIQCVRLLQRDTFSQSLLDAYTVAVHLLPQLAWMGLSVNERHHQLVRAADTACDAAAAALEANRPELAVEWLEQGRSVVWSQFTQLRTPLDDLRAIYPELAAQFERVSHQLERASARDKTAGNTASSRPWRTTGGSLEDQAQAHHQLAILRERLLTEIRALPGFDRFLLPKTIDLLISSLARSESAGPVVFLNASKHGCDALIVCGAGSGSDQGVVRHVPISNVSYDQVVGMRLQLSKLLVVSGRTVVGSEEDSERGARLQGVTQDEVFGTVLSFLWDEVVSPVLKVLDLLRPSNSDKLPRIFWCPTGPFTFLPVHAAGRYDKTGSGARVSNFVISSYIPTMSALEPAPHEDSDTSSGSVRLLLVPQPSTDGQRRLRNVEEEMRAIRELASSAYPSVDLEEADGTVEDVMAKMTTSDWVHFACHAVQDRARPMDSGMMLAHGRRLKVSDVVRLWSEQEGQEQEQEQGKQRICDESRRRRQRGGLAFLSACQTATGDEQLTEEAVHVAAGMLLAGYAGVVATMWTIMDSDAPRVAEVVYERLFSSSSSSSSSSRSAEGVPGGGPGHGELEVPDGRDAAEALHHAIERLRDSGAPFLSWVPFIHVGQ